MSTTQRRAWLWYSLIWVPVAPFYAIALRQQQAIPNILRSPLPWSAVIFGALNWVVPCAVLGVVVWRLTASVSWPPAHPARFVALHVVAATVFSTIWLAAEVWLLGTQTSMRFSWELSKTFRGFQAIDGVFVYALIAVASYAIRITIRLREQEARTARAETLRMHAELSALRAQLNPHFLFNTLHTLTALVRRDPATAEAALERFGDMLRYVLDVKRSSREDVTLAEEMRFVRNYLTLEQLRLGDRLRVSENIDPDALDCILPSLTLQPLVENAIKYGVAPRARGGLLEITGLVDDNSLILEVRDDGPGAPSGGVELAAGVGLRAVRQRLETRYGERAEFVVTTAPGQGFTVRVGLPAHTGSSAEAQRTFA